MKKSVGIIPYKIVGKSQKDSKYYFFVGHPGGWTREWWSLLKGGAEGDEDEIETALREFKEESGVDLSEERNNLVYLGIVQQNKEKKVAAFAINYPDIDPSKCFSNLIEDGVTPEIDRYCWMEFEKLEPLTHPAHIPFYKKIMGVECK